MRATSTSATMTPPAGERGTSRGHGELRRALLALGVLLQPVLWIPPSAATEPLRPMVPAATPASAANRAAPGDRLVSVIVQLKDAPVATYRGGVAGLAATSPRVTGTRRIDAGSPAVRGYRSYLAGKLAAVEGAARSAIPRTRVLHRYDVVVGGLALQVPENEVARLAALPGVQAVYPDSKVHGDSEKSASFIGAPAVWSKLGGPDDAGEGTIVGVIDSGVWPEHPSFADPDPKGKPYTAPPGTFACEFSAGANPGPAFACNGKLIGAYRFLATWESIQPGVPANAFSSARDDLGHGTHTASTAAGNRGVEAEITGADLGTVSGIAPRAHVIAYKALGYDNSGFASDLVAAIQQAIVDGVDVINYSISGSASVYDDPVEIAFRDAYAANVFVAASASNDGPGADTVQHNSGWVTTVGASTEKQTYRSTLTLVADDRDKLKLKGASITGGIKTASPVVLASSVGDELCANGTADGAFTGKIVACLRGGSRTIKGINVAQRGAVGMILYSASSVTDGAVDVHALPTVLLTGAPSDELLAFLASHTGVVAKLTQGKPVPDQGDVMASFSSRGGIRRLPYGKPDVTAPGIAILAGNTPEAVAAEHVDGQLFQVINGTSMAAPHVAGSAALLRHLHPSWTAGQIKSALMTSATRKKLFKQDGVTPVDPFDAGSGRIALKTARDAGLTFDVPVQDYTDHQNDLWNVNYPNVSVPSAAPTVLALQRTARSELATASTWKITVSPPPGVAVTAPAEITVPAGGSAPLPIQIDKSALGAGEVRFGALDLAYKGYRVHLPITVAGPAANLRVQAVTGSSPVTVGGDITVTIDIENVGAAASSTHRAVVYLSPLTDPFAGAPLASAISTC